MKRREQAARCGLCRDPVGRHAQRRQLFDRSRDAVATSSPNRQHASQRMHDRIRARQRAVISSRVVMGQIALADQLLTDADASIAEIGRDPLHAHLLPFAAAIRELRRVLLEASLKHDLNAADFQRIAGTLKAIQIALDAAADIRSSL